MIPFLFKTVVCSAFFLLFYKILLEKGKTCNFNRFYLIAALILPFVMPLLSMPELKIHTSSIQSALFVPIRQDALIEFQMINMDLQEKTLTTDSWNFILPVVYIFITCILFIRLVFRFYKFRKSILNVESEKQGKAILISTNNKSTPYTILNYIFIPQNQTFTHEIIQHEMTHVNQKHTLDIFLVEILQVFCWFNPALPFYRRAIALNHEYLADESVVNSGVDRDEYLRTLLAVCGDKNNLKLCNQFNKCSTIKKRIKMMMKKNSKIGQMLSIMSVIPMLAVSLYLFTGKSYAQSENTGNTVVSQPQTESAVTSQNNKLEVLLMDSIFAARYKEYNQIVENNKTERNGRKSLNLGSFSDNELNRMKVLFLSMTPEQQSVLPLIFQRRGVPDKKIPKSEEFESWKNPAEYGIWIDGKRVENTELNRYQPSDFSLYFVSRLARNAKNYGKHVYQLDLFTNANYKEWKAKVDADETLYMTPQPLFINRSRSS